MTRHRTFPAATLALILALLLTACADSSGRVGVEIDGKAHDRLAAGVKDLGEHGREGALRDLTTFPWDNVYVFFEGASRKDIETATGDRVDLSDGTASGSDYYSGVGALLVFTHKKHATRAIAVPYGGITEGGGPWPITTRLIPGSPGTPGTLTLRG
ncbi:hypothetical protein [Embleya scabrispora]|uniref:hypothetical protein n=1 Tax=Embleya scabrispora TaxID=159449 RepID=UPI00036C2FA4|nr:hypothetical protein [Embleya scabrispora]MYS87889.1 hypothetical protein [Streptomyces sp. SID5474]